MREITAAWADGLRISAVLWRMRGEHVARLIDVGAGPGDSIRLVLDDGAVALREVLARDLELGEAVTVLVPIADCIEALRTAGVEHGAIGTESISFDARGAPVLGGFGAAVVIAQGAGQNATGEVDRVAFRELAREVLTNVLDTTGARARLLEALDALDVSAPGCIGAFAGRLLMTADPLPVRLGLPPRVIERSPDAARTAHTARRRGIPSTLRVRLGAVRARFWVPASSAVLVLGVIASVLPAGASPEPGAPSSTPSSQPTVSAVQEEDAVAAALRLRRDASAAKVIDDYGDVVLVELETPGGPVEVLIERTDAGWRLRDMIRETD